MERLERDNLFAGRLMANARHYSLIAYSAALAGAIINSPVSAH